MTSRPLSILHISTADSQGGSARSARRIHEGLRRAGHVSRMLVGDKGSDDPDVDTVHGGRILRRLDRVAEEATKRLGLQYLFFPSSWRVKNHPWVAAADIVQIYNTHGGYFTHRLLPALAARAPIVWRLSDAWAVTGHCAYPGDCQRWRTGCGNCPDLKAYPPIPVDTTAWLWRIKQDLYRQARPVIVAPSSWTENIARSSPLFREFEIRRIPNGVDRTVFKPLGRAEARTTFALDPDARTVLFSAQVLDRNPRKGSAALVDALNRLGPRTDLAVILVGGGGSEIERSIPQRVVRLGFISDKIRLARAYAAADLVVVPSVVENLPNSVIEALACGTPAVAFDAGGLRDAVRHGETGWLVPSGDTAALHHAIETLLADRDLVFRLGQNALALAKKEFDAELEIRRFTELYSELARSPRQVAA